MRPTCILLIAALVAIPAAAGDAAKQAMDKLKGAWVTTEIVEGGKTDNPEIRLEFDGDKVNATLPNGDPLSGTYAVDATKTPPTLDLVIDKAGEKVTVRAIYELKGEQLRFCHSHPLGGAGARPTALEATADTVLVTLKRTK